MQDQFKREAVVWPEDVREMCKDGAQPFEVSSAVHYDDFIFRFLYDNPVFKSKNAAINYYFSDGNNSASKVKKIIDKYMNDPGSKKNILEFASGYGAVTRHAISLVEPHVLHSCDIHGEATSFIEEQLKGKTVLSSPIPEKLVLPCKYDFIFVLSFFSHMPELTWKRWLERLVAALKDDGVLLFTTHGELSMKYFPQAKLNDDGYWFEGSSEQKDLDVATYGQTITTKDFVDAQIADIADITVLKYEQGGWWEHQDLYILKKKSSEKKLCVKKISLFFFFLLVVLAALFYRSY